MPALGAASCLTHGDPEGADLSARQPQSSALPAPFSVHGGSIPRLPPTGSLTAPCSAEWGLTGVGGQQWPECLPNLSPLVSPPTGLLGVLLQPSLSEPDRRAVLELRQCHHQADLQQQLGTGEILPRSAFHLGTGQPQGSSTTSVVVSCREPGEAQRSLHLERDGTEACKPPGSPSSPSLCSQLH